MKTRLIALLLSAILFGCVEEDCPGPPPISERTVLVYMSADNNLSSFASANLQGLISSSTTYDLKNNNLIVYVDQRNRQPCLLRIRNGVQDTIPISIVSESAGTPEVLSQIISKVRADYNSESYGLILWGHGTSWLPAKNTKSMSKSQIVPDYMRDIAEPYRPSTKAYGADNNNIAMSVNELRDAIPDHLFDYIIFDACYMAGIEVAYALRNKADFIVSSVAEIWDTGMPYHKLLRYLFAEDEKTALKSVCSEFYNYYYTGEANRDKSATISLVATAGLPELAEITSDILKENKSAAETLSLNNVQRFDRIGLLHSTNYIAYDMADYISRIASAEQLVLFNTAIGQTILFEKHTDTMFAGGLDSYPSFNVNTHCGLMIYPYYTLNLPINDYYRSIDWYKAVYE